jgi:CBS-domain-containing membrane protein
MENYTVKNLMVPLSEYATVPEGSTLLEAVMALEEAQEAFESDHSKYHHRAILILNRNGRVIGKLSQLNVLRAFQPKHEEMKTIEGIKQFGFSSQFIAKSQEQSRLRGVSLRDISTKAAKMKVEDFMKTPSEGEYVEEDTSLDTAIHQLVMGLHLSLLVTSGKDIVGVLRISDVFAAVYHAMKESELAE